MSGMGGEFVEIGSWLRRTANKVARSQALLRHLTLVVNVKQSQSWILLERGSVT